MFPFALEATVDPEGRIVLEGVPFPPGTVVSVSLEVAEPMDREAFEAALREHYERP